MLDISMDWSNAYFTDGRVETFRKTHCSGLDPVYGCPSLCEQFVREPNSFMYVSEPSLKEDIWREFVS